MGLDFEEELDNALSKMRRHTLAEKECHLKAQWTHASSQVEICDKINKLNLTTEDIISVNNDDSGNWWLLYFDKERPKVIDPIKAHWKQVGNT